MEPGTIDLQHLLDACDDASDKVLQSGGVDGAEEARALEALLILSRQHVTAETLAQTGAGRRLKKLSKKGGSTRVREAATAAMNMWKERVGWKADSAASSGRGQQSSSEPHTANHGGHAADVGTQQRGVQELRAVTGDIPAALLCHCGSLKKLFTSIHGLKMISDVPAARARLAELEELHIMSMLDSSGAQVPPEISFTACPNLRCLHLGDEALRCPPILKVLASPEPPLLRMLSIRVRIGRTEWQKSSMQTSHIKGLVPFLSKISSLESLSLALFAEGSTSFMSSKNKFSWDLKPLKNLRGLRSLELHEMPVAGLMDVLSCVQLTRLSVSGVALEGWPSLISNSVQTLSVSSGPLVNLPWLVWSHFPRLQHVLMEGRVQLFSLCEDSGVPPPSPPEMSFLLDHDGGAVMGVVAALARLPVYWAADARLCLGCTEEVVEATAMLDDERQGLTDETVGLGAQAHALQALQQSPMGIGLRHMSIQCVKLTPTAIILLSNIFPNLASLTLDDGAVVLDKSLAKIVAGFPHLSLLKLPCTMQVSAQHIQEAREAASRCNRCVALTVECRYGGEILTL